VTEEKRRIRIGNQTAYFAGSPVDPFVYAVENGFDAFEWFPDRRDDSGWSEEDIGHDTRAWIAKTALKNDIRLSVHAAWWTNPLRPESHAALSAAEMFAVDIGACLLNIHLFTGDGIPRFLESLLPLVRRLSGAGITLTLENTPGTCPDDLNEFFRLLAASQTDISGVGMCLDIGHANLCESTRNDYLRYVDELGQHVPIRHVHLHENSGDSDSHLTLFTGPAGRDPAGIEGLVERLERRLFSGAMILEQWPEPRDLLVDARQRLVSMFNNTAGPGSDPRVVSRGTSVAESPAVTSQPDDGGETPMIIYNLFPLLAGRLGKWEDHFTRASEMGFTWIFVNPVQLTGPSGSIYSIADYFAFNPLLLDEESGEPPEEQVRAMLRSAHRLGLRVMVDLVINHCSADSPLLRSHPEWFAWEAPGRVSHPFANEDGKKVVWKDLAQFDFKNTRDGEGLFRYILGIVTFLSGLGFDGFRCDAAYQVPRKIWEGLIRETRKDYPEAVFFAETLGCTPELTKKTASAGFDYIFNSSKWWDFRAPWLMEQYALTRDIAPSISFPESHDTARLGEEMFGNINGLNHASHRP
jgi:sugar phosphate isomerase/epimerase